MRTLSFYCFIVVLAIAGTLTSTSVSAQADSIITEIESTPLPLSYTIAKARSLLLEKLLEGDYDKVKQIKDYMVTNLNDEYHVTLSQQEHWLILFYTHEWDELSQSLLNYSYNTDEMWKLQPVPDLLSLRFGMIARDQHTMLEADIKASIIEPVKKDFLVLALRTILETSNVYYTDLNQQEITLMANYFLKKYPESPYHNFVRRNCLTNSNASAWGMEYEFSFGYGTFTNQLSEKFKDFGTFGFAFNGTYNNFTLYGRGLIGFSKTLQDITSSSTAVWLKDSKAGTAAIDLTLGYSIINHNRWRISPFAGYGGVSITADEKDKEVMPQLDQCELKMIGTFVTGIVVDFNFSKVYIPHGYSTMRLRYSFHATDFTNQYPNMSGTLHNVTLGVNLGGRFNNRR